MPVRTLLGAPVEGERASSAVWEGGRNGRERLTTRDGKFRAGCSDETFDVAFDGVLQTRRCFLGGERLTFCIGRACTHGKGSRHRCYGPLLPQVRRHKGDGRPRRRPFAPLRWIVPGADSAPPSRSVSARLAYLSFARKP